MDLDDVFAYSTPRVVKIRDRKLCFAKLLIILGIFFYVVIWSIIVEKGYLSQEAPAGFTRLSFRSNGGATATGPECGAQALDGDIQYKTLPCLKWGEKESVYPSSEEASIFLTTRVGWTTDTALRSANVNDFDSCYWQMDKCKFDTSSETYYYTPGVDDYTLLIGHTVYGPQTNVIFSEREMKGGKVKDGEGKDLKELNLTPDQAVPGMVFSVKEMMDWTGIELDKASEVDAKETNRFSGGVIVVYIEYRSSKVSLSDLKFEVRFVRIGNAEDKLEQTVYSQLDDKLTRTVINRHGLRFIVIQAGTVGKFSFTEMLKTLVTAFALFGVATFIVEKIFLRFMPYHNLYKNYRSIQTVDFSEVHMTKSTKGAKGAAVYMAGVNKKKGIEGYPITSSDFVYGTLIRGHRDDCGPTWAMDEDPHNMYKKSSAKRKNDLMVGLTPDAIRDMGTISAPAFNLASAASGPPAAPQPEQGAAEAAKPAVFFDENGNLVNNNDPPPAGPGPAPTMQPQTGSGSGFVPPAPPISPAYPPGLSPQGYVEKPISVVDPEFVVHVAANDGPANPQVGQEKDGDYLRPYDPQAAYEYRGASP